MEVLRASSRLRTSLGFLAVVIGVLLQPLDFAVNIVFPLITDTFNKPADEIRWVVIAFVLTYGSLMLVCGKIGDVVGHEHVFRCGLLVSAIGLFLCWAAWDYPSLVVFRVVQGFGIALTLSGTLDLLKSILVGWSNARTAALRETIIYGGAASAPLLGGLVTTWGEWNWVFGLRAPLAVMALMLSVYLPSTKRTEAAQGFDWLGAGMLIVCMSAALLAISNAKPGLLEVPNWMVSAVALLALAGFVTRELFYSNPIVPLVEFRNLDFVWQQLSSLLANFFGFSTWLVVPYFLHALGWSPLEYGALLAVAGVSSAFGAVAFSLYDWTDATKRVCSLLGILACGVGMAATSFWDQSTSILELVLALSMQGLGLGLVQGTYSALVSTRLGKDGQRGVASSLIIVTRTIGVVSCAAALQFFPGLRQNDLTTYLAAFKEVFWHAWLGLLVVLVIGVVLELIIRIRIARAG